MSIWRLLPGKSLALQRAEIIAERICKSNVARKVSLFGSLSYLGAGHDIDLIVEVSDEAAQEFFELLHEEFADPDYYSTKYTRLRMAMRILGFEDEWKQWIDFTNENPSETEIDIFLFPADWRHNPMVQILNKRDKNFIAVLGHQVKHYHWDSKNFSGLGFWATYFGKYFFKRSGSSWERYKKRFISKLPVQYELPF